MMNEINKVIDLVVADFADWTNRSEMSDERKVERIEDFKNAINVRKGKKYYKIVSGGSVWGFVVAVDDDPKFRKGDLLKPASWATPARNAARGNVLDGIEHVNWTGPNYLK